MNCKLVLLAAGLSRRYGPENKLLAEYDGRPLYRHTLDALEEIRAEIPETTLLVVTQYPEIARHCARRGILWVENPRAAEGISTSLQLGLTHGGVAENTAFFVADQPRLTGGTIRGLLAGHATGGKGLACVRYGEDLGNPCIFHRRYAAELLALSGDRGGKAVLKRHPEDCWFYPLADGKELEDVDYC